MAIFTFYHKSTPRSHEKLKGEAGLGMWRPKKPSRLITGDAPYKPASHFFIPKIQGSSLISIFFGFACSFFGRVIFRIP